MSLDAWRPVALPERVELRGRYVTLEPLSADHEDGLIAAYIEDLDGKMWDWLPTGRSQEPSIERGLMPPV